jgi:hypothetical protein
MKPRSSNSKPQDIPKKGSFFGRVVSIVDLGLQPGWTHEGVYIEPSYQLSMTYELVSSKMEDGRPHWVSEDIKNSDFFDPKKGIASKLMKRVYAIDPTGEITDNGKKIDKLLTQPCMVTVDHNKNGYAKVVNVAGAPEGIPIPELVNSVVLFDLENPSFDTFAKLTTFTQTKIINNMEFEGSKLQALMLENNYTVGQSNEGNTHGEEGSPF